MVRRLPNANAAAPTRGAAALCAAGWRGERRYGLGLGQVPQTGLELVPGTPPLRARLLPHWHELSLRDAALRHCLNAVFETPVSSATCLTER